MVEAVKESDRTFLKIVSSATNHITTLIKDGVLKKRQQPPLASSEKNSRVLSSNIREMINPTSKKNCQNSGRVVEENQFILVQTCKKFQNEIAHEVETNNTKKRRRRN